jgi:hypothetical protein
MTSARAHEDEHRHREVVFRNLATEGLVLSDALFKTLTIRYLRVAQDAVKQYEDDAAINGLPFDRHQECSPSARSRTPSVSPPTNISATRSAFR